MQAPQLGRSSQFERRRPLFWLALAFCLGIFLDSRLAPELSQLSSLCFALLTIGCLIFFLRKEILSGRVLFLMALTFSVSSGAFCHALGHRVPPATDVSRRTSALPSFVVLRGVILETKRAFTEGGRPEWTISVDALGSDPADLSNACGRVALKIPPENLGSCVEGQSVLVRARLEAPPEATLPDGFDQASYLKQQGIRRVGIVLPDSIENLGRQWWRVDLLLRSWSTDLSERVEGFFPAGEQGRSQAALLTALLFGRRERVSNEDREAFAIAGTAHLLAISGLHIQFFGAMLFRLAGFVGLRRRRSAAWVMVAACAYCALAGANPPILRATTMIVFYLGAMLFWREPDPLSVLGAVALLILSVAPDQLFGVGFQLSFAAVFSLVTLLPVLALALERRKIIGDQNVEIVIPQPFGIGMQSSPLRLWAYFQQSLLVTFAATLGTAPIVAYHMGRVSIFSLWINLLAVPIGYFCIVLGSAALAFGGIPFLATILIGTTVWLTAFLEWFNVASAHLPGAAVDVPPPTVFALLAYGGILFFLWHQRLRGLKLFQLSAACGFCALLLFSGLLFRETVETPCVTILDIPHGRAALLEDPDGNAAMIDAGGEHEGLRLAEILRKKGIHRLALLVLTADEPDAIGGALELLRRVPAARVLLPRSSNATEQRRALEVYLTSRSIPFETPGTGGRSGEVTVLKGPAQATWQLIDDNSEKGSAKSFAALFVRLELPGRSILFADIRANASVQRLLDKGGLRAETDLLCLSCSSQRWPQQAAQLIRNSHCKTVVVTGRDPVDMAGLDLQELAESAHFQLVSPTHGGSLRVRAETGLATAPQIETFQGGVWKTMRD